MDWKGIVDHAVDIALECEELAEHGIINQFAHESRARKCWFSMYVRDNENLAAMARSVDKQLQYVPAAGSDPSIKEEEYFVYRDTMFHTFPQGKTSYQKSRGKLKSSPDKSQGR